MRTKTKYQTSSEKNSNSFYSSDLKLSSNNIDDNKNAKLKHSSKVQFLSKNLKYRRTQLALSSTSCFAWFVQACVMFVNPGMVWIMLQQETHVQDMTCWFPKIPFFNVPGNSSYFNATACWMKYSNDWEPAKTVIYPLGDE